MAEAAEFADEAGEPEEMEDTGERPVARNGDPVDRKTAAQLVRDCLTGLWEGNEKGGQRLAVTGDPMHVKEAVQDAFVELWAEADVRPEVWMSTASVAAADLLFTDWNGWARRTLNKQHRDFRDQRAAGLGQLRISGHEPGAPSDSAPPPAEFAWIEAEGLGWGRIVERFPALEDHHSPVLPTMVLRWFTGWDANKIANSLARDVTAADVFVRLVRLLRQYPREWMELAGLCSIRHGVDRPPGRRSTRTDVDTVSERNGWCDPFAPAIRDEGIALLVDWMAHTGKLTDPVGRPEYEWPARAKRELVARRVATGFTMKPWTYKRERLWAPPEGFASIAAHLTMQRNVTSDTARVYFKRLQEDPANGWIKDLLPRTSTYLPEPDPPM